MEHPQPRRSHASFFQSRDNDRGDRVRSKTCNLRCDQRACNFNRMAPIEVNNESLDYESDAVSYVVDRDQGNLRREEQTESCGRQCQQQHSYCNLMRRHSAADRYTEIKVKSFSDCSRRPIRCPRLDCSVNVAFSALTHHFIFDHPDVPILTVEPGTESKLIVSYGALSCNSSRCLALLLVSGKLSLVYFRHMNIVQRWCIQYTYFLKQTSLLNKKYRIKI